MRQPFPSTVIIPAGSLAVTEPAGQRRIELPAFSIGRTPVTNGEYASCVESGRFAPPPWWNDPDFSLADQPVVGVTWDEAAAFCAWLASRDARAWRLPSEAEWERAMSGGADFPPTPWGPAVPEGEIPVGPLRGPWRTGQGSPNAWGVLDPGTVVHEWCLEWRDREGSAPAGAAQGRARRASRGGSWRHRVRWSTPSARSSLPPDFRYSDFGFRVLREEPG
ncbi:MAG: formylglycine-generating enzyme family protein [Acidobacteriota bacterium]|nr:formylglycine-generating enzyme family protein [Acidobacteriota bacterium]